MKQPRWMAITVGIYLALWGAWALGFRVPKSASLPFGIYRFEKVEGPLERGQLVRICLPEELGRWARRRGYLRSGPCAGDVEPVVKRVVAISGDRVEVAADGVRVEGRVLPVSRTVSTDSAGRPLPSVSGEWLLEDEQLWLYSGHHPRSLDSRIYGPVAAEGVRELVRPVWTADSSR